MIGLLALPLLPIIYEDLRYRAIHWFWVVLFVCLILGLVTIQWQFVLTNLLLLTIQLIGLTCYFSLKNRRLVNIINSYLGLGDIVFFLPLCLLFSPLNFIAFLVIGFIGSMMLFGLGKMYFGKTLQTIPLAAYLSIFLIFTLWGSRLFSYSLTNDTTLLANITHLFL